MAGGGPLFFAELENFAEWTGATSFTTLCEASPDWADQHAGRVRAVHYWGQFTDELPAPWRAEGGHQYVWCKDEAEARATFTLLLAAVKQQFPKATIHEEEQETLVVLPANVTDEDDLEMHIELAPASEYDSATMADNADEVWSYTWGPHGKHAGLLWEMHGMGVAYVAVQKRNHQVEEIIVVRTWTHDDSDEDAAKAWISQARIDEEEKAECELHLSRGRLAIVWAPIAASDISNFATKANLLALDVKNNIALSTEDDEQCGLVVAAKPGRWQVTYADIEEEPDAAQESNAAAQGSARWIRLRWIAA